MVPDTRGIVSEVQATVLVQPRGLEVAVEVSLMCEGDGTLSAGVSLLRKLQGVSPNVRL